MGQPPRQMETTVAGRLRRMGRLPWWAPLLEEAQPRPSPCPWSGRPRHRPPSDTVVSVVAAALLLACSRRVAVGAIAAGVASMSPLLFRRCARRPLFPSSVSVPALSRCRDAASSSWSHHAHRRRTVNGCV